MKLSKNVLFFFLLITLFIIGSSWGFLVHRTVHQLAIYQLPKPMRGFFYSYMDSLVKHSVRPDLRRNSDSTEATKHFIDLEAFGDSAAWKMPMNWDDAVKQFTKDSLVKYGYVPYHIITMKNRLTNAFKQHNTDSILFFAADIGHYIGDANVPLHTTLNYDGQLTNQRGLHSLWESFIPDLELEQYNLYSRHKAKYLDDPKEAVWKSIRRAYLLLPSVFNEEKEASKEFNDSTKFVVQTRNGRQTRLYSPAFAKAYSKRLQKTVNEQLIHSADLIADFWFTAWVDAGKPDLSKLLANSFDKKELKKEKRAYKRNELIEQKLLTARQNTGGSNQ